jgi:hypothetical protein
MSAFIKVEPGLRAGFQEARILEARPEATFHP